MAKKAKVKCPYCEEKFDREEGTKVASRYYHVECLTKKQEENKFKAENPDFVEIESKGEGNDYRNLISYICDTYDLPKPTGMILKQIKTYKDEYEYTYKGMELALRHFYDTERNSVKEDSGIGIVPYIYDRAKNFYIKQIKVEESIIEDDDEIRVFKTRQRESSRGKNQIDLNEF